VEREAPGGPGRGKERHLRPENTLSIIFDHRSRGVGAAEGKPKVETLDLVCTDQAVGTAQM
jgi:hypothetical protein